MTAQPWEARLARLEGINAQIADRLNSIDNRVAHLETRMDGRFAQVDGRFAQVDARFAQMDGRLAALEGRTSQQFMWIVGLIVSTWITTVLTILLHR
jgi:flagellar capping protein FliD